MREWLGLYSSLGSSSSLNYKLCHFMVLLVFVIKYFDTTCSDCGDTVSSVEQLFTEIIELCIRESKRKSSLPE